MEGTTEIEKQSQYLTFKITGEDYAVDLTKTREIIEYGIVTPVPMMPSFIRGVLNLRGSVVPVIDLAVKFGMKAASVSKWTCILIVEAEIQGECIVMGVVADTVSDVHDFSPEEIEETPPFGTSVPPDFLSGMGKIGEKLVMILNIDRVLSATEQEAIDMLREREEARAEKESPGAGGGKNKNFSGKTGNRK